MKQQKRTLRTIALVIAITLLTKVLGVVREALQARVFGTALAFDLYTISYNNTIYIFTTVAYALCVAAVPIISKKLETDRQEAFRTAGNLICVSLIVSLVLTALLTLVVQFASPPKIQQINQPDEVDEGVEIHALPHGVEGGYETQIGRAHV